jgi:hypothetical protein
VFSVKRIVLLGLTLAAFVVPAGAHAAVPCRDKVYNEWYSTGKISTSYPVSCYQDALKHVPTDAQVYSNLGGDIRRAMQVAISRHNDPGGGGPASVGSGPGSATGLHQVKGSTKTGTVGGDLTPHQLAVTPLSNSSSGSGIPTPIIVLGVIAILLALAGLIGTGAQMAKKRRAA